MQPVSFCVRRLGIALLLAWAASGAWAQTAPVPPSPSAPTLSPAVATKVGNTRIGTFKQVHSDAWIGADTARRAVQLGARVGVADRLSNGPQGAATLTLKDGTVLTPGPDTVMDLRQFQFDGTNQQGNFLLDLLRGSVRVVGVRGIDFIVETQDTC